MSQRLQNHSAAAEKTKKSSFLASNPVLRRLDTVDEYAATDSASYGGIAVKTIYFLLFSVAGIILQLILSSRLASSGESFTVSIYKLPVTMTMGESIALLAAVLLAIVFQLLAFFARPTTPVTGALYCVTQGYFISFLIFKVLKGYEYLGALALAITMMIILVMSVLYSTGIIRVTKKFKMVMITLVVTMVGTSLLMFIGYFIPFTRDMIIRLQDNFALSIIFGVIFIIIAALFLICDFATIDHVVKDQLPKKYEWMAAFGLSFTVLWLYLKVLQLILTILGNKKN